MVDGERLDSLPSRCSQVTTLRINHFHKHPGTASMHTFLVLKFSRDHEETRLPRLSEPPAIGPTADEKGFRFLRHSHPIACRTENEPKAWHRRLSATTSAV